MKKISITDSEKKLLFIVLALVILAASYYFGFMKLTDAAKIIEKSNESDLAEVTRLEGMVAKQAETERETEGYKKSIANIIEKYPSSVPQEKAIYLVQQFQNAIETDISSISFSMNNLVQTFSGENAPSGRYANLIMSYSSNYDQFKEFLQYVADYPDRTNLPSITAAYDQRTGMINGTINYRLYFLTNTEREYQEFPPTNIPAGKSGIFYPGDYFPAVEELELDVIAQ